MDLIYEALHASRELVIWLMPNRFSQCMDLPSLGQSQAWNCHTTVVLKQR